LSSPALAALGYAPDERVVIIHVDDVGMCQATLPAFAELAALGTVTSGSVMVPCPWFPAAAEYCRAHPEVDMGLHITLTSEWSTYRWRPLSTNDPASGLIDADGYFHHLPSAFHGSAALPAVDREMRAQLDRALAVGIDVTHIDTHMYSVFDPQVLPLYLALGVERSLPAIVWRPDPDMHWSKWWTGDADRAEILRTWEARGLLPADHLEVLRLRDVEDSMAHVKNLFNGLQPGLTHLLMHPALDTPELRAITPDWRVRVAEYEVFRSPEIQRHLRSCGVRLLQYRALREVMRSSLRS
jgi:chitin disaccharide deacetylase